MKIAIILLVCLVSIQVALSLNLNNTCKRENEAAVNKFLYENVIKDLRTAGKEEIVCGNCKFEEKYFDRIVDKSKVLVLRNEDGAFVVFGNKSDKVIVVKYEINSKKANGQVKKLADYKDTLFQYTFITIKLEHLRESEFLTKQSLPK